MYQLQRLYSVILPVIVLSSFYTWPVDGSSLKKRTCFECELRENLFDGITNLFPPRTIDNTSVTIYTKLVVKELMEMSVKEETLKILAWIRMFWFDLRAEWNPAEYGDIREVRMLPVEFWVPDMMITNSLDNFEVNRADTTFPLIIGHTGLVFWSVPMILHTKCQADVTYFPFDQQNCKIKLNSWTYHEKLLKLEQSDFNTGMEERVGNIEWMIADVTSEKRYEANVTNHPLYVDEVIRYPYIEYSIFLKRKPDFYVNSLVIPSLLLSWLGSVIFLLPSECGEKLGFAITLFLSLYVNQVIVAEFLPPSADSFPLIARFYTVISVMLGCSIVLTASSLMLHFRITHEMIDERSALIRFFLLCEKLGRSSFVDFINRCFNCFCRVACLSGRHRSKNEAVVGPQKLSKNGNTCSRVDQKSGIKLNYVTTDNSLLDAHQIRITSDDAKNAPMIATKPDGNSNLLTYEDRKSLPVSSNEEQPGQILPQKRPKSEVVRRVIAECSPVIEDYLKDIVEKLAIAAKDDAADIALKRWRLIAAGLDKIFFVCYTFTLATVTVYFGTLAWEAKSIYADGLAGV